MRRNHIPPPVQAKLDTFERTVERLTKQLAATQAAIDGARQRLSGGFQKDSEYHDLRASLAKLVTNKPLFESKLDSAQYTLRTCRAFLAALPDDAVLTPVAAKPNGLDLATVHSRINDAEDEIKRLRAVPTPSADIEHRIRAYVSALCRPKISGIGTGQQLQVHWPDGEVIAVLALLLPDQMVNALMKEIERQSNAPMPLAERKKRIGELTAEIDALQRQSLSLGAETSDLPPEVILGVRLARREETKRVNAA
jgi:hypothetical protein